MAWATGASEWGLHSCLGKILWCNGGSTLLGSGHPHPTLQQRRHLCSGVSMSYLQSPALPWIGLPCPRTGSLRERNRCRQRALWTEWCWTSGPLISDLLVLQKDGTSPYPETTQRFMLLSWGCPSSLPWWCPDGRPALD